MWWKNFLNNPQKVSLLPREHLEKSLLSSVKQLEKMNINYYNSKEKIKKLCYDYCKFVSDNELKFYDKDITEFGGESNKQTFLQFLELATKNDRLEEGIYLAERIRNNIDLCSNDQPNPSRKENGFHRLSQIVSSISQLALETSDEYEKHNYTLAIEILLRETKSVKESLKKMKQFSQRKHFQMHIESSYLTLESVRLATEIHNLQNETKTQHIETSRNKLSFILKSHIESLGDTSTQLQVKEAENEALKTRIKNIQSEVNSILQECKSDKFENIDELIFQETNDVRLQLTSLELEENDLMQRKRLLKSELRSTEEDKNSFVERQKSLERDIQHLSTVISQMNNEISSRPNEENNQEIYDPEIGERILELNSSIEERQQKLESLSSRNETMKQEIGNLSNRIHVLKDLLNSTKNQVQSNESKEDFSNSNEIKSEINSQQISDNDQKEESLSSPHSYEDI